MSSKESSVITTAGVVGVLAVTGAALLYANSRSKAPLLKEAPRHGGDLVAEALAAHNVKFVFTLIGGHISPILVGAKSRGIRIIDVRHEVTAVFAADAVSRLSDSVGVACVTAGPGLTNTITAVKNAQMAASPLVLLGGATLGILKGRGSLQDIDQQSLFRGQVKWQTTVSRVADIIPTLDKAFHIAKSGVPGPVFVELPLDTLYPADVVRTEVTKPYVGKKDWTSRATLAYINYYLRRLHAGDGDLRQSVPKRIKPLTPLSHYVQRAAEMLRKAERPVLVLGAACVQDAKLVPAVAAAARALGLPTWLSSAARGLLGPADPIQFKHKRSDALRGADLVLLLGVVCDFRLKYGAAFSSRTPLISVHPDRDALYLNRTPTLPVVASPALFLVQLADLLRGEKIPRIDWFTKLRDAEETREREIDAKAAEPTQRDMNPLALCKAIDRALARKSVLVADGGDFIGAASYVVRPRGPLSWLDPGPFGTLGVGAGFALGAKLCRPDAEVWLLWGDGSAGYSIMEYDTFVRHGIPVIGVIGNDSCWTQIARDQVPLFDDDVGCPLSRDARYERVVAALGGAGWSVGDDGDATLGNDLTVGENDNGDGGRVSIADLDEVFARAKKIAASGRPVLVNALIGGTDFRQGSISI